MSEVAIAKPVTNRVERTVNVKTRMGTTYIEAFNSLYRLASPYPDSPDGVFPENVKSDRQKAGVLLKLRLLQ
ncbi:hypothetical protein H6G89_27685 [Oscillatoria sp. FACHB-1407]|uniref:hypothetical protein n=1 Tax=Oscillatoria sp. FACHB-1407 TaxID=2692847 RepID=UPI0016897D38|nr:hypothetical protein [Oscillatoria sp. FACHB-1407]MBD2464788.1 hypothetical protein [Oscillatoria sp. FACHB-1407]